MMRLIEQRKSFMRGATQLRKH